MKKSTLGIAIAFSVTLLFSSIGYADNYDLPNMTVTELNELKSTIDEEIQTNHDPSSDQESAVEKASKEFVEAQYGEDNVSWAWFDYTYTKDWDFYTFKTHADITKQDGGKAEYNIYTEVVANGDSYQVVYAKIGEEEIFNDRARIITDQRILKMLGLEGQEAAPEAEASGDQPNNEAPAEEAPAAEDPVVAQRGDKNDTALSIQQMLIKLGYLDGGADGSFGEKTENAVKQFQTDKGLNADGIVTQSVFDSLKTTADAAPEPEEVITISAVDLYNQFENNAIAAKENYKGKTIQVTGTVDSIEEGFWGDLYVTLNADEYGFSSVQCFFKKDHASTLATLSSGQTVTVKGSDPDGGLNVTLQDCSIVG